MTYSSAITQAIIDNNLEKVKELVRSGADINKLDDTPFINPKETMPRERDILWSPIDLAVHLKREEIFRFLLEKGAMIGTSFDKDNPGRFSPLNQLIVLASGNRREIEEGENSINCL